MTFWQTLTEMIYRPMSTLRALQYDEQPGRKGLWMLLLDIGVYTVILAIFLVRGYPAAAPSILNLSADQQYAVQIWYQGPLFLLSTAFVAGILVLLARTRGQRAKFDVLFARVSFSTALPFALTTMLVESAIAVLLLARVLRPDVVLQWLTVNGLWFATLYQTLGIAWLVVLTILVVRLSIAVRWSAAILIGCGVSVVYALPIAFFIR